MKFIESFELFSLLKRNRYDFSKFEILTKVHSGLPCGRQKENHTLLPYGPRFFLNFRVRHIKIVHCGGNQWGLIMVDFVWDKVTHYHVTIGDLI